MLLHSPSLAVLTPHVYVVSGVAALPFTCSFNATCVCCKWCCPSTRSRGVCCKWYHCTPLNSQPCSCIGWLLCECLFMCVMYWFVMFMFYLCIGIYVLVCISLLCCVCCLSVCSLPPCNKHTCFAFTASRLTLDCIISCLHVAQSGTFSTLC